MQQFHNKVVIVTGASSGIGAETAIRFASLGAKLSITGRNADNLNAVKEQCVKSGRGPEDFLLTIGDITDEKVRTELIESTLTKFQRIDVLVNNAGMGAGQTCSEGDMAVFHQLLSTNLIAPMHLSRACIPHLAKSKGNIVNVSSIAGQRPADMVSKLGMYGVSKAALDQFTKTLAIELGNQMIRVNSVNPAAIKTPIFKRSLPEGTTDAQVDAMMAFLASTYPNGFVGQPSDVAFAITYLASEDARFINGHCLMIDGGKSLQLGGRTPHPSNV